MRLWSTVVTHEAMRPRRQSARYVSVLTATRASLRDVPPEVELERGELPRRPAAADGRHVARRRRDPVLAVDEQRVEPLRLHEQRARRDRRAVAALALQAVALRADADPLVPAQVPGRLRRQPGAVRAGRLGEDTRAHLRVQGAAELTAAAAVRPRRVGLEPRVRLAARNRVELAAQLGDPPAVIDVVRVDVDLDDAVDG